jgi:hypothetical protein
MDCNKISDILAVRCGESSVKELTMSNKFFSQICSRAGLMAATLILFAAATQNASASSFTITWTGGYGPGDATLTATPEGAANTWLITVIAGEQNGTPISFDSTLYGGADDFFYQPPDDFFVDHSGISFTDGTNEYNIFSTPSETNNNFECSSADAGNCEGLNTAVPPSRTLTTLSITPATSTVPEPTTAGLLGLITLGSAALIRKLRA